MPETENVIKERKKREKELLVEKIREMPIIQVACHKAGVARATFYRWKHEDLAFSKACDEAMQEGIEFVNDLSESQVVALIKKERIPAITLWLKNHHPTYGAKVRTAPQQCEVNLTPEQEAVVRRALKIHGVKKPWRRKRMT